MVGLSEAPVFRMVGLLESSRYSYGWLPRGPPVFEWLDTQEPPGSRIVEIFEATRISYSVIFGVPRFSYVLAVILPPVFVWLDS